MSKAKTVPAYRVEGLTKIYPRGQVLANDDLSLTIEQGEIFGLLGPNGAGKTTLVRQLMGLVAPTRGSIDLLGHPVIGNTEIIPLVVAYLTQRPLALADLTVEEALKITGHLRGLDRPGAKKEAHELIEDFGLKDIARRVIGRLSGGQQRLTGFCLALIDRRPILILDEPTNDLDPVYRKKLWDRVIQVNREWGTSVILVTHNVLEAERVLQRVGIINKGRIVAMGTVSELKSRIDTKARVLLTFKDHVDAQQQAQIIKQVDRAAMVSLGHGRYVVLSEERTMQDDIQCIMQCIGMDALEDLRIQAPTLEDVYLQLGGGEQFDTSHVAS